VHCSLLRDITFGDNGFLILSWCCLVRCYKEYVTVAGLFPLYNSSFYFWLCASVLLIGHCVVADAGCNWYLRDINIFHVSKNS
jgi:hypothetical protein